MTHTLAEAKSNRTQIWLTQYVDFHRYEMIFIVTCATMDEDYTERDFKTFASACKHFNKMCELHGMADKVIW